MTKKIYTKTGDKGETGTMKGRMSKSDALTSAIGVVDELNSWVGLVRSSISPSSVPPLNLRGGKGGDIEKELKKIQNNLFIIGSILAGSKAQRFRGSEVTRLEELIDRLTLKLPKLNNFVYPIGYLQVARSVARRAEREVVAAIEYKSVRVEEYKNILKYLNRLSDALFVTARWVNFQFKVGEEVWKGGEELS